MKSAILDSSAWIELLGEGPNTAHFRPILMRLPDLLVPTIIISEVRKVILRQRSKPEADAVTRAMCSGEVIPLSAEIAVAAADLFASFRLPLADSIIYATAITHNAVLWTQDQHFDGLPHVKFFAKS